MNYFQKTNVLVGWLSFLIAAIVYFITLEPTVSLWDCGEFITAANKLQVGHPPGAPVFMLLARFFTIFAPDVSQVALLVNCLSALASAFTILFLFWTITHMAKKMIAGLKEISFTQTWAIVGAGFIGAMAYTFSDSFWFSAVEGEVYATSSLFTAVVFWCILKWENEADQKYANRWIILIAYLMGLSIGVHLLNLLTIPAIVMLYYFKSYTPSREGVAKALGISILLLGGIMYAIIPGVVKMAFLFDLFFVNSIGLPFNIGALIFILLLITGIIIANRYTHLKGKVILNTIVMGITVILIGYSSYAVIMIRSAANPSLDQNNPEDLHSLLYYLNRDQYGDSPLLYGHYFNAPLDPSKNFDGYKKVYAKQNGKYEVIDKKAIANYSSTHESFFPRMHSKGMTGTAPKEYAKWTGIDPKQKDKPTFAQNLDYFFSYQLNYMYIRYFMWNFVGRQSDKQSYGGAIQGNWISGISFIDNWRLGDQSLRSDFMKQNKGNNKYYFLPFLLGIIGLLYQYRKSKKSKQDFWVVMLLFVFTGLAIVIYLNQPPLQPRERDYAYVGSFYAFAIWIGLGLLGIYELIKRFIKTEKVALSFAFILCLLAVPTLIAQQNWDDHNRSKRYAARDWAYNYLNSCEPNAILFTMGDNDTFPLWYLQEVEGVRTDVRVCNLSYLATDWYIDQMKQRNYKSAPLPIQIKKEKYIGDKRLVIYAVDDPRFRSYVEESGGMDIKEAMEFLLSDLESTKKIYGYDEKIDHFPAKRFYLKVDKDQVLKTNTVDRKNTDEIVDQLQWNIKKGYVEKNAMIVYDILINNNWKRPVYFAITVPSSAYMGLDQYFQLEGFAYRLVPILNQKDDFYTGKVKTDKMYQNLMKKFKWGNINDPNVYVDENIERLSMSAKLNFLRLSESLLEQGKRDSAVKVLDRCLEILPSNQFPLDYQSVMMATNYYRAGEYDKGNELMNLTSKSLVEDCDYFFALPLKATSEFPQELNRNLAILQEIYQQANRYQQKQFAESVEKDFTRLVDIYKKRYRK
jgi:hypothetical protein